MSHSFALALFPLCICMSTRMRGHIDYQGCTPLTRNLYPSPTLPKLRTAAGRSRAIRYQALPLFLLACVEKDRGAWGRGYVKVSPYAKVTLDLPGLSKDDPLPAGRPHCQSIPVRQVPLDVPGLSRDDPLPVDRQTPLSKYPCTPKLPWTSLDYPRITHCQQADPSVKVSPYAKVTLGVPGLSKDDP